MEKTMEKELVCVVDYERIREAKLEKKTDEAFFIAWVKKVIRKLDQGRKVVT